MSGKVVALKRITARLLGIAAVLAAMLLLSACGGADPPLEQKASMLLGGALSNFGGADGTDPDARAVARDIATSRSYDFTPAGFVVASGAAASTGLAGSGYGAGPGTLTVLAGAGTVELAIASTTPGVDNVIMSGTFEPALAQLSINTPGSSFMVSWTVSFDVAGESFTLSADQVLSGSEWVAI